MANFEAEIIKLVAFCLSLAFVLSGTLYIITQCRKLNGIANLTVIQKRYSKITNITVAFSIFMILIVFTFKSGIILFETEMTEQTNNILLICFTSLKIICFHAILYLMVLRFWLMFFDVQWTIATLDKEWTVFLDPNVAKKNWYFSNLETYGNWQWLLPRLILFYLISISISITMNVCILLQYINIGFYAINMLLILIPIVINIVIYTKTPTFYDHYYMRDEMKAINNVFILYLIMQIIHYIIISILINIENNDISTLSDLWHVQLVYIVLQVLLIGALCFICTGWVVRIISSEFETYSDAQLPLNDEQSQHPAKFRFIYIQNNPSYRPNVNNKVDNLPSKSAEHGNALVNNTQIHHHNNYDEDDENMRIRYVYRTKKNLEEIKLSKKLKLPQILSANESFTLFMQHLSRESNVATLLSFVEYVQFKQLLKDNLSNIQAGTFGNAKLAPSIPKSSVVHTPYKMNGRSDDNNDNNNNNNNTPNKGINEQEVDEEKLLEEFKCRAYMLYNKYIKRDAELELKLQPDYKKALDEKMDELDKFVNSDIDANQLFHIFDDVIFSQYQIMWKSYQRFVNTGDYQLVENLFHQEKKK